MKQLGLFNLMTWAIRAYSACADNPSGIHDTTIQNKITYEAYIHSRPGTGSLGKHC